MSAFGMLAWSVAPERLEAQLGAPTGALSLKFNPSFPAEYKAVTVTAESFSTDLNRASISWLVDGKVVEEGLGKTSVTFKTGALGKTTSIAVIALTPDGERLEQSASIVPAEVDVVYESRSYTHPFYRGKTLLPPASKVTVTAIPNMKTGSGTKLDSKNIVFTWRDGSKVLGILSGTGKNSITIDGPQIFRAKTISVEASSLDNTLRAKRSLDIGSASSVVALYEAHPLFGVLFENALRGSVRMVGNEISLLALPYFFSTGDRIGSALSYTWRVNGQKTENLGSDSGLLTLRPEGDGVANISAELQGVKAYLERESASVDVSFNQEKQGSL